MSIKSERKDASDIECCANCKHCLEYPKNNSYGDIEYLCAATGYFTHRINEARHKFERYTPGGKKLECKYERKEKE